MLYRSFRLGTETHTRKDKETKRCIQPQFLGTVQPKKGNAVVLVGKLPEELPEVRRGKPGTTYMDVYPLVWNRFEQSGYATMFAEDRPDLAVFNLRLGLIFLKFSLLSTFIHSFLSVERKKERKCYSVVGKRRRKRHPSGICPFGQFGSTSNFCHIISQDSQFAIALFH